MPVKDPNLHDIPSLFKQHEIVVFAETPLLTRLKGWNIAEN